MGHYHSYLFGGDGTVTTLSSSSFENDAAANDHALGLFVGQPHAANLEVWEKSRKTLSYNRPFVKNPLELRRLCYLAIAASKLETDPDTKRSIAAGAFALAQEAEALTRREN